MFKCNFPALCKMMGPYSATIYGNLLAHEHQ
jgi:hypothetical protein